MSSPNAPPANEPPAVDSPPNEEDEAGVIPFRGPTRWLLGIAIVLSYGILATVYRIPAPPPYQGPKEAQAYCHLLEGQASGLSSVNAVYALLLTLVFIGSTYLAMSLTSKNEWVRRALFATTLICAPVAFFLYQRSDAAVELAGAASEALKRSSEQLDAKEPAGAKDQTNAKDQTEAKLDGTSYRICVGAWGEWVKSRIDSNQIGRVALQESAKTRDAQLDKRIQQVESVSAKAADAANRMQQVEGLSTKTVDAANRVEAALAKVTQALESKKPKDLSAAQTAVDDANAAIKAATTPPAPQTPP